MTLQYNNYVRYNSIDDAIQILNMELTKVAAVWL